LGLLRIYYKFNETDAAAGRDPNTSDANGRRERQGLQENVSKLTKILVDEFLTKYFI